MKLFPAACSCAFVVLFSNISFSQGRWIVDVQANEYETIRVWIDKTERQEVEKGKRKEFYVFGESVIILLKDKCGRYFQKTVLLTQKDKLVTFPYNSPCRLPESAPKPRITVDSELARRENAIVKAFEEYIEQSAIFRKWDSTKANSNGESIKPSCDRAKKASEKLKSNINAYKDFAYKSDRKERANSFIEQNKFEVDMHIFDVCSNNSPIPDCLGSAVDASSVNVRLGNGKMPLPFGIENNCSGDVINNLIEKGAIVDFFGDRFEPPDNSIYKTPLALACIRGDSDIVNILIKAKAPLYPPISLKKEQREHIRFLRRKCSKDVIDLLVRNGNPFPDERKIIEDIESNMLLIEGGTFTFGCLVEQGGDCPSDALPRIPSMAVASFYLSKFEVTQEQWEAVMDENPSYFSSCQKCPVEMVTWNDVQVFLQKLNELTGKKYRLPTEVEWEFAAKGGKHENRYVFSGSNNIDSVAWYGNNSEGKTHEAGSKAPNALGLYDMSGNVYEWCNSSYTEDLTHYLNSPLAVANGGDKVLKGGSWRHTKRQAKVSFRWYNGSDIKSEWYGFRLALDKE